MRVVAIENGSLVPGLAPDPEPAAGELVIEVAAAGVNRADTSQVAGRYAPPAGASPLPGLEVSGTVLALGSGVTGWAIGDRVCALLAGGGYAERVAVPAGQVLRAPSSISLVDAAGLPETLATVWVNLTALAGLSAGETLLVHGGSSGIGTTAIQLGRLLGARVLVTAGSPEKLAACAELGAEGLIDHRTEDFVTRVREETDGRGADVILDLIGADYLSRNLEALAMDGRLVVIGIQSGTEATLDLRAVLSRRARITGSLLRARPPSEKAEIIAAVAEQVMPAVESGRVRPVIHTRLPLSKAARAHELITSSRHIGKILLVPGLDAGTPDADGGTSE